MQDEHASYTLFLVVRHKLLKVLVYVDVWSNIHIFRLLTFSGDNVLFTKICIIITLDSPKLLVNKIAW